MIELMVSVESSPLCMSMATNLLLVAGDNVEVRLINLATALLKRLAYLLDF